MIDKYFDVTGPTGDKRGRFKVIGRHLTGKTITYRPARWYERFWLWTTRTKVKAMVLHY